MLKKMLPLFVVLGVMVSCSSAPQEDNSKVRFISYNSNKDDYPLYSENGRVPASTTTQKHQMCADATPTKFLSYHNEKEYFFSAKEAYFCK